MLVGMLCTKNCGISEDGDTRFLPLIGAGAGAAIGGLTGSLLIGREIWVPVDLQLMR